MGVLEDAEGGLWSGELSHTGETAACSACQEGYYKSGDACTPCISPCATCTDASTCTSCPGGKYLNGNTCVADSACGTGKYADPITGKFELCTASSGASVTNGLAGVAERTACGSKISRVALDGTSTCVEKNYAGCAGQDNTLFILEDNSNCLFVVIRKQEQIQRTRALLGVKLAQRLQALSQPAPHVWRGRCGNTGALTMARSPSSSGPAYCAGRMGASLPARPRPRCRRVLCPYTQTHQYKTEPGTARS